MKTSCSLTASVTRLLRIHVSTVKALEDAYKWITQFIGVVDVTLTTAPYSTRTLQQSGHLQN